MNGDSAAAAGATTADAAAADDARSPPPALCPAPAGRGGGGGAAGATATPIQRASADGADISGGADSGGADTGSGGGGSGSGAYYQIALYAAGNVLAVGIVLLAWFSWDLLRAFQEPLLWAWLCSLSLRDAKAYLTETARRELRAGSLAGCAAKLAFLPLVIVWQSFVEVRTAEGDGSACDALGVC